MALIQNGGLITEIRGKVGDYIYSRNCGGAYVKSYASPVQPDSSEQLQIREWFYLGNQFWQKMSDDCKLSWTAAAGHWNKKMNHFRKGSHVGYNYFISSFVNKCIADDFPFNNIVRDPGFDMPANWSYVSTGIVISSSKCNCSPAPSKSYIYQSSSVNFNHSNQFFYCQIKIDNSVAGVIAVYIGSGSPSYFSTTGLHSYYFLRTNTSLNTTLFSDINTNIICDDFFIVETNQFPHMIL